MLDFSRLKKNISSVKEFKKTVKVSILADAASQLINQAIKGYGLAYGVNYDTLEADYNQIDLQIFDPGSELYEFQPEVVLISRASQKILYNFYKTHVEERALFAERHIAHTKTLCDTLQANLNCKIILNTYAEVTDGVYGNYGAKLDISWTYQIKKINLGIMELARDMATVSIADVASLITVSGYNNAFDNRIYTQTEMVYTIDFLPVLAKAVHDIIAAGTGVFKKCLIIDLDNTMWGGIIGDDGLEGIQIGSLGAGKIFTQLQYFYKELKQRGIILCVCSKNELSAAQLPFTDHPDMILRMEDIAVFVANWETKVDNIRYIQSVLNIGFDSMVFLDDNPFEREMVKQAIPEVAVPNLPDDAADYLSFIISENLFETATYSEEDRNRTSQYREEAGRTEMQKSFTNEAEFLESLAMKAVVKNFDAFTIPRIAQLSQRSNQFNLRTERYTDEDVKRIAADSHYVTLSFNLEDKFGDNGLIAYVILKKQEDNSIFIDSWVMSCRVLKRGMERFTLEQIFNTAKSLGADTIVGEFIQTAKNNLVKDHYQKLGFTNAGDGKWVLTVNQSIDLHTHIKKI